MRERERQTEKEWKHGVIIDKPTGLFLESMKI